MLLNEKGEKIGLVKDCKMIFDLKDRTISFFDKNGGRMKMLDDNKITLLSFITNETQCIEFAIAIGRTHGLGTDLGESQEKKIKFIFTNL